MPHLATDRISRGLRWAGVALLLLGVALVIGGIGWTTSPDALIMASAVALLAFGVPGAAAFGLALWLEHTADRLEHPVSGGSGKPAQPPPADRNPFREPLRGYVIAVIAVAAAWAARLALDFLTPGQLPFFYFYFAVMVAGWFGGFGPAALATLACLVITWQFYVNAFPYFATPDLGRYVALGLFVLVCLGIAAITAALHAALERTQQLAEQTRRLEAELARLRGAGTPPTL
jgi:predicted outer membrane lipoprotein